MNEKATGVRIPEQTSMAAWKAIAEERERTNEALHSELDDMTERCRTAEQRVRAALPPLRAREEIARDAKRRADEFVRTGFRDLGVPSLEPYYVAIVAELLEDAMLSVLTGAQGMAITATPLAAAGQEWRDISSAPKDGSPILCVWWSNISVGEPLKSHVGICWWSGGWNPYARTLTHWMPLPAPPVAEPLLADKSQPEAKS